MELKEIAKIMRFKTLTAHGEYQRYEIGESFYGKVEFSRDDDKHLGLQAEISGASFRFDNIRDVEVFIDNLQRAKTLMEINKKLKVKAEVSKMEDE